MPNPPKKPVENTQSYFEKMCELVQPFLKINLNFDGFEETIDNYNSLKPDDFDTASMLMQELNAWSDYFSDISNLIQHNYLDSETFKVEIQSRKSIDASEKNVSAGDRRANIETEVIVARKVRNALKSLYDNLTQKIKFLERAYYHCKAICEWQKKLENSPYNNKED